MYYVIKANIYFLSDRVDRVTWPEHLRCCFMIQEKWSDHIRRWVVTLEKWSGHLRLWIMIQGMWSGQKVFRSWSKLRSSTRVNNPQTLLVNSWKMTFLKILQDNLASTSKINEKKDLAKCMYHVNVSTYVNTKTWFLIHLIKEKLNNIVSDLFWINFIEYEIWLPITYTHQNQIKDPSRFIIHFIKK